MNLPRNRTTRVSNLLHLPAPINCLRFLSASIGAAMLLFLGPLIMLWGAATSMESVAPDAALYIFMKFLSFIILLSSGYLLVGLHGHRIIYSPMLRVTAAILLTIPIYFARIPFHGHRLELPFLLVVLLLYFLLLSTFVWPAWFKRSEQPHDTGNLAGNPASNHYRLAEN